MLTVQTLTLSAVRDDMEDWEIQGRVLAERIAPAAFAPAGTEPGRANSMWLGSQRALDAFALTRGSEVHGPALTHALRGHDAVGRPGALGSPGGTPDGKVTSGHLTFAAPNSVSWLWTQADQDLRADLEQAMVVAADRLLGHLTQTRPLLDGSRPGSGHASAIVLHAIAERSPQPPPPLLHVHCFLVGVADEQDAVRSPDLTALTEETVGRECGAVGRAVLAEELGRLGFRVRARTGHRGRYFEVDGIPPGLLRPEVSVLAECHGPVQEPQYARGDGA